MNVVVPQTAANSQILPPDRAAKSINALVDRHDLRKATVIGAGTMGSGIAALLASAGIQVLLLDVAGSAEKRNGAAEAGIARQLAADGFLHPDQQQLIKVGNIDDNLDQVADADWIVEAIVEDLASKRDLYNKLDLRRKRGALVSSNTSTIPLRELVADSSDALRRDFVITHFFNPPRRMQLLELVTAEHTDASAFEKALRWSEALLGKSVVPCRDTPGFIANRIGNYWMSVAALEAKRVGLSVEDADAVMATCFGVPRTGVFGLFDLVGINLVPLVWGGLMRMLPVGDAHREHDITSDTLFTSMLTRGLIGRSGPGGFYRRKNGQGERVDEVIDLNTGEYRPRQPSDLNASTNLRELCEQGGDRGEYAWRVLSKLVYYCADIAEEISEDPASVDLAMRIGYNWGKGPFELADAVGLPWVVDHLERQRSRVPALLASAAAKGSFSKLFSELRSPRGRAANQTKQLSVWTSGKSPIFSNKSASVWDVGDGIACLEIHTRLNACDQHVTEALQRAIDEVPKSHNGLIIGSDNTRAFSAGANLDAFISFAKAADWSGLRQFVTGGQQAMLGLKYARFPVVAAAAGLALGGGCELMMHCDAVVAHSELQAGFPELKVGIIPGWGGCSQLLLRHQELGCDRPDRAAEEAFSTIASCVVSGSALVARQMRLIRHRDHVMLSRERLLAATKDVARELSIDYSPPKPSAVTVTGTTGRRLLQSRIDAMLVERKFTEVDAGIAEELAIVLTGGTSSDGESLSEAAIMRLEVDAVVELAKRPTTLARLEHMRATNKPLRN